MRSNFNATAFSKMDQVYHLAQEKFPRKEAGLLTSLVLNKGP
jgi:hypothetical protein